LAFFLAFLAGAAQPFGLPSGNGPERRPFVLFRTVTQAVSATVGAVAGPVSVSPGKMIYGANGRRIGAVYRVTAQGNPQLIIDGKLVTVPASTLSSVDGKVTTSLSKADIDRGN